MLDRVGCVSKFPDRAKWAPQAVGGRNRPGIQNNINLNNIIYNHLCTSNTVVYNSIQMHTIVSCCIGLYTFAYD